MRPIAYLGGSYPVPEHEMRGGSAQFNSNLESSANALGTINSTFAGTNKKMND
jgi:hypothetical protein